MGGDNSTAGSRLFSFVSLHVTKLCVISYFAGVIGFLVLPYRDISEHHYHSENALLTGLQTPNYGRQEQRTANLIDKELVTIQENDAQNIHDKLIDLMTGYGITAYKQTFSFKHPLPMMGRQDSYYQIQNGTNVYGFIRAGRAASTESIVLNIPISSQSHNSAVGFALSIGRQIRAQPFWAKDIVLLFTEMGYVGSQAWLQSYYGSSCDFINGDPLQERAGAILAALNLEFSKSPSHINVEVVGNKGQLPNLDLVNVITKLSYQNSVRMAVGGVLHRNLRIPQKNYHDSLTMCLKMLSKQAKGFTEFNHATFLQHNIQSLTIQGVASDRSRPIELHQIGRIVEGAMRSLNNLLEKLHHSYFFYLISATDRFISIVLYMPPLGLILLAPTLKALCLWMESQKKDDNGDGKHINEDEEFLRRSRIAENEQQQNSSPWMGVFYRLAVAELLGVLLYFSPTFATSWSAMYGIEADHSLAVIFLSTYVASLVLPFNPLVSFQSGGNAFWDIQKLLRIVALLIFSVIIGCTAVLNFSLAMVVAVASVPCITPISTNEGRLKLLHIFMALLASPIVVAVTASYLENFLFNGTSENLWNNAAAILKSSYEQSLLENSWNYEIACLLLYPSWMLFWFIAVAKAPAENE